MQKSQPKMNNKSQSAIELMILVGFVVLFFTLFFVAIQQETSSKIRDRKNSLIKEIALTAQNEIILASSSSEGYSRKFQIPEKIMNQDYSIELIKNTVYITTEGNQNALSLLVPEVTGEIKKGENIIKKENGKVYIN